MTCWADVAERQHQRDEERADAYDAAVDSESEQLVRPGQECYPFDIHNAIEALDEADSENLRVALAHLAADTKSPLHILIKEFWAVRAYEVARVNVDNREDD